MRKADLRISGRRSFNPSRTGCLGRGLWDPCNVHLSRDARLAQPLGQPVDVRLIAKWEPADVLGK